MNLFLNQQLTTLETVLLAIITIIIILVIAFRDTVDTYVKLRHERKMKEREYEHLEYLENDNTLSYSESVLLDELSERVQNLECNFNDLEKNFTTHRKVFYDEMGNIIDRLEVLELKADGIESPKVDVDELEDEVKKSDVARKNKTEDTIEKYYERAEDIVEKYYEEDNLIIEDELDLKY